MEIGKKWGVMLAFVDSAMNPDDLLSLVTHSMPYGKYKGRLLADLPGNYLNWFAREGFPPGELGRLLALIRNRPQRFVESADAFASMSSAGLAGGMRKLA